MAPTIVCVLPEDGEHQMMEGFEAAKRSVPMRILKTTAAHEAVSSIQVRDTHTQPGKLQQAATQPVVDLVASSTSTPCTSSKQAQPLLAASSRLEKACCLCPVGWKRSPKP